MNGKDFGKIAMALNEFGNLEGIVTIGNVTGELRIKYADTNQILDPEELRMTVLLKRNEYREELMGLVDGRDKDEPPTWRMRNLDSYIRHLDIAINDLNRLSAHQREREAE